MIVLFFLLCSGMLFDGHFFLLDDFSFPFRVCLFVFSINLIFLVVGNQFFLLYIYKLILVVGNQTYYRIPEESVKEVYSGHRDHSSAFKLPVTQSIPELKVKRG